VLFIKFVVCFILKKVIIIKIIRKKVKDNAVKVSHIIMDENVLKSREKLRKRNKNDWKKNDIEL